MEDRVQSRRNGIVTQLPDLPPSSGLLENMPTHRHEGEFEWFYCVRGGGIQIAGSRQEPVQVGTLLLIPPGVPHVFACGPAGCCCEVLMMPGDFPGGSSPAEVEAAQLLAFLAHRVRERGFVLKLPPEAARTGGALLTRIRNWMFRSEFGSAMRIQAALLELLSLAFALEDPPRFRSPAVMPKRDDAIETVLYFLDNNFHRRISVDEAARIAGLSRSTFARRFAAETGQSFCVYLNSLRIRAVEGLTANGVPLPEAVHRCGFFSRSNFFEQRRKYREDTLHFSD